MKGSKFHWKLRFLQQGNLNDQITIFSLLKKREKKIKGKTLCGGDNKKVTEMYRVVVTVANHHH